MKVIYLAGPYRVPTEHGVQQNIEAASRVALEVWKLGAMCFCPHKNTAFFGGALPDAVWLKGDFELIRRSDAVLMMDGWMDSAGARDEAQFADAIGKRVFLSLRTLERWLGYEAIMENKTRQEKP